jgi:hypothetical protein
VHSAGAAIATLLLVAVGLSGACKQTVTAPDGPHLRIDVGSGGSGTGGAIRVNADACACITSLVILVDGVRAGSLACNGQQSYAAAAGEHTVTAADSSGNPLASATVTVTATAGAVARVSCI